MSGYFKVEPGVQAVQQVLGGHAQEAFVFAVDGESVRPVSPNAVELARELETQLSGAQDPLRSVFEAPSTGTHTVTRTDTMKGGSVVTLTPVCQR